MTRQPLSTNRTGVMLRDPFRDTNSAKCVSTLGFHDDETAHADKAA